MPKVALLTGYSGFLGRYTMRALVDAGWQVRLAGRAAVAGHPQLQWLPVDLEKIETVLALRETAPVEAIVHLGCRVGWSGATDGDLMVPNVLATGVIADLSRSWGAQLVFASAALVHGVAEPSITPQTALAPDTPYSRSKWLGEQLIEASGTDKCILRMGGLFGRRGPGHLRLNRAIDLALTGRAPTVVGQGSARRNYLFVKDAAEATLAAVDQRIQGTHLLAGPQALSVGDMLGLVCEILSPGLRPTRQDGAEARDQIIARSSGFGPGVTFADALRDIGEEHKTCALV